ncbi:tRNA methyltransferase [Candidatus Woesearchaeota archaeon]|nr:tRNA methyltransferase [Candidatus Woesearchaeota archaeon]
MARLLIFRGITHEGRQLHPPQTFFVKEDKDFTCQHGTIAKEELTKPDGSTIKSNTGKAFVLLTPNFGDLHARLKKAPQTIPHKDIGRILVQTGITKESIVVDAGLGSGALAIQLANTCKEVIAYEKEEATISVAKDNLEFCGTKNITIKHKDIYDGIDETNVDVITLDLPEPWKVVEHAAKALKHGGWLVAYNPTIGQIAKFNDALGEEFMHEKNLEIIERAWDAHGLILRPKKTPIGHSGFLSFARKV